MQKRTFRHIVILLLMLLTLTGCTAIQTRVSDCQVMLANTFSANIGIPQQEYEVLLLLDEATQGGIVPGASGKFPCKSVPPPCQWNGVYCASGHITMLVLTSRELNGEIPPELASLPQLQKLSLVDNNFSGDIPAELGNLSQLRELFLGYNQLSGEIPPELGQLSQLEHLHLESNQLSGQIPAEIGNLSQLRELTLGNNPLSGPLPPELTKLTLSTFYISYTDLCIPPTSDFGVWITSIDQNDLDEVPYCD